MINPYLPPENAALEDDGDTWSERTSSMLESSVAWSGVYGLNSIVPLLYTKPWMEPDHWLGTGAAMAVGWIVGLVICVLRTRWMGVLTTGATVVALSQVFPIIQFFAALIARLLLHSISGIAISGEPRPISAGGFFVLTLSFVAILLAVSAAIGLFIEAMIVLRRLLKSGIEKN